MAIDTVDAGVGDTVASSAAARRAWPAVSKSVRSTPRLSASSTPSKPLNRSFTSFPGIAVQLARVIGTVVVTPKDENLTAVTLLLVQPMDSARQPVGKPRGRRRGAGVGEDVLVRGKEASFPFTPQKFPSMPASSASSTID